MQSTANLGCEEAEAVPDPAPQSLPALADAILRQRLGSAGAGSAGAAVAHTLCVPRTPPGPAHNPTDLMASLPLLLPARWAGLGWAAHPGREVL